MLFCFIFLAAELDRMIEGKPTVPCPAFKVAVTVPGVTGKEWNAPTSDVTVFAGGDTCLLPDELVPDIIDFRQR
jgi:hypothetical protein